MTRDPRNIIDRAHGAYNTWLRVAFGRALVVSSIYHDHATTEVSEDFARALLGTAQGGTGMNKVNWHKHVIALADHDDERRGSTLSNKEPMVDPDAAEVFFQRMSDLLRFCGFNESDENSFRKIIGCTRPLLAGGPNRASRPYVADMRHDAVMNAFQNLAYAVNSVVSDSRREISIHRQAKFF